MFYPVNVYFWQSVCLLFEFFVWRIFRGNEANFYEFVAFCSSLMVMDHFRIFPIFQDFSSDSNILLQKWTFCAVYVVAGPGTRRPRVLPTSDCTEATLTRGLSATRLQSGNSLLTTLMGMNELTCWMKIIFCYLRNRFQSEIVLNLFILQFIHSGPDRFRSLSLFSGMNEEHFPVADETSPKEEDEEHMLNKIIDSTQHVSGQLRIWQNDELFCSTSSMQANSTRQPTWTARNTWPGQRPTTTPSGNMTLLSANSLMLMIVSLFPN